MSLRARAMAETQHTRASKGPRDGEGPQPARAAQRRVVGVCVEQPSRATRKPEGTIKAGGTGYRGASHRADQPCSFKKCSKKHDEGSAEGNKRQLNGA